MINLVFERRYIYLILCHGHKISVYPTPVFANANKEVTEVNSSE